MYLKHGFLRQHVDHVNYDIFDKNEQGAHVNYDIFKIGALGYHDNYDVFEKYFLKTMYFTVYLTHWNFSRFKYVVFYSIFDTRTGATRHKTTVDHVNYDIFDKKAIANHVNYDIFDKKGDSQP